MRSSVEQRITNSVESLGARSSKLQGGLLAQEYGRQTHDVLHIHVSVPIGVKKLGKDGIRLGPGLCDWSTLASRRPDSGGGARRCRSGCWTAGLEESDDRWKNDWEKA